MASSSSDDQLSRTLLQAMRYGQLVAHHDIVNTDHGPAYRAMLRYTAQFTKDIQAASWGAFWSAYHHVWCGAELRGLLGRTTSTV